MKVDDMSGRPDFTIYVDGSCLDNQNVGPDAPTGWGIVIVTGDSGLGKGGGEVIHEENGEVITDENDDDWIGAEVGSNNTAELSAFAMALRWLLLEGGEGKALIRTDSTYAGNLADGTWKAKANRNLVSRMQKLWGEVSTLRELEWKHIRAHRGHRWNERADHLAIRAASGEVPIPLDFWKPGQR